MWHAATVDIRLPRGVSAAAFERRVADLFQRIEHTSVHRIKGWDPNWTALDRPFVDAVRTAATDVGANSPPPSCGSRPATQAGGVRAGVPAVCHGPQPTLSAGIDDHAQRADVIDCVKAYLTAALRYMGADGDRAATAARRAGRDADQGDAS